MNTSSALPYTLYVLYFYLLPFSGTLQNTANITFQSEPSDKFDPIMIELLILILIKNIVKSSFAGG